MLALLTSAACDLDETPLQPGERFLVVQSVVMPDSARRIVVVERSLSGDTNAVGLAGLLPPESPNIPVRGATVRMTNLDLTPDPCGTGAFVDSVPIVGGIYRQTDGVYHSGPGCPTIRLGDRLQLEVALGSDTVRGTSRAPNFAGGTARVASVTFPLGDDTLRLNRDRDSLVITADGSGIRGMYVIVQGTGIGPPGMEAPSNQTRVAPQPTPSLETFGDSAGIALPGDIRHTFLRGTGEATFVGGRRYRVVAAAMDTNYFDALTTDANRLTGRGYRNRLHGGVGVFGSMVPRTIVVEAVADQDDPREGLYAVSGTLDGVDVSVTADLYLRAQGDSASAFLSGDWTRHFTEDGWQMYPVTNQSVNGRVTADSVHLEVVTIRVNQGPITSTGLIPIVIAGARQAGPSFTVTLFERLATGTLDSLGTLTAVQQ